MEKEIKVSEKEWQDYLTETAYNQGVKDTMSQIKEDFLEWFNEGSVNRMRIL